MRFLFLAGLVAALNAPLLAQPLESSIAPPRIESASPPPVFDTPIEWKPVRDADGKPLAPQTSGEWKAELVAGAWARARQFDSPRQRSFPSQSYFDDAGFAGFAVQPRLTGRNGKVLTNPDGWRGTISSENEVVAHGAWNGDENGGIFFSGLNPYVKRGILKLDFADPKRPPEADGSLPTLFRFEDLAYPTQINTFVPVDKTLETPRGSKVTLLGYGRYEPGLPTSADGKRLAPAGIYFFVRSIKPELPKGVFLSKGNMKVGARDGKINSVEPEDLRALVGYYGDLHEGKGISSDHDSGFMTHIFAAPDSPRPLHLQMQFFETHSSWKQLQYFPSFSFPLDPSRFPMPPRDTKFAPLATAKNAEVEVALDLWQDRSYDKIKRRYLAWFWTRDLKIKDDPSLRWVIKGGATRPQWYLSNEITTSQLTDGGTTYRVAPVGFSQWTWRFRPDGSPVLGAGYRPALTFSADAIQGPPQKWDMSVEFAQWRLKKHEWKWKAVPVPPMGEKLTLNRTAFSPTGVAVKIVNVAVYDASHRFAGIENILDGEANPQGVAISFEAENADFSGPKKFEPWETLASVEPNDGPAWNTLAIRKGDEISGLKNESKVARWTWIYPLQKLEANSFDLDLSWGADYPTGRTATFRFPNLPAPAKDSP